MNKCKIDYKSKYDNLKKAYDRLKTNYDVMSTINSFDYKKHMQIIEDYCEFGRKKDLDLNHIYTLLDYKEHIKRNHFE